MVDVNVISLKFMLSFNYCLWYLPIICYDARYDLGNSDILTVGLLIEIG